VCALSLFALCLWQDLNFKILKSNLNFSAIFTYIHSDLSKLQSLMFF
jgi:hypothetical protein